VTLATEVATASKEEKLSPPVKAALADVIRDGDALAGLLGGAAAPAESPETRKADQLSDTVWGSLHGFLRSHGLLPGEVPTAQQARQVLDRLFPDGLMFLKLPYKLEWAEAEAKLGVIAKEQLEPVVRSLGGGPILDQLASAHAAYGKALGITAAKVAPESPAIRAGLLRLQDALRRYVVRVVATMERDDPTSEAFAARLLAPIEEWEIRKRAPAEPAPIPPTDPTIK
jgi:hypothetical protein